MPVSLPLKVIAQLWPAKLQKNVNYIHPSATSLANFRLHFFQLINSVADPDPGFGAFLPPGSGIRIREEFFSGSRISDPAPFLMTFSYNIFRIHVTYVIFITLAYSSNLLIKPLTA
jgi:hypothetical protein